LPSPATLEWLDIAGEDEQAAAVLKAAKGPWSIAAYHLQQSAEKYIKAALVEAGVAPPKSHDLVQLIGLFPGSAPRQAVEDAAAMISAFAWMTRYPGAPSMSENDFLQAEPEFAAIKAWANAVIDPSP
jgi:HEPN domain-containing protein